MRTIMLESPLEGGTDREAGNVAYAKRCMNEALQRGEAPFLSHLLYTHTLDDTIPEQRARGIEAGHAIAARLEAWVFYLDRGVTRGMLAGIDAAVQAGFRPWHKPLDDSSVFQPYERLIEFRTFMEGVGYRPVFPDGRPTESGELMLHECDRWPELLVRFEYHARQDWDLPR